MPNRFDCHITTRSGQPLDLRDPSTTAVRVEDIAGALSQICRFGGQSLRFYSVAQHAIEVAARVPPDLRLAALHHDSHEAYAGDLPSPLKRLLKERGEPSPYDQVCDDLDRAIAAAVGASPAQFKLDAVKRADKEVLYLEAAQLLARPVAGASLIPAPAPGTSLTITGELDSRAAEALFLSKHAEFAAG